MRDEMKHLYDIYLAAVSYKEEFRPPLKIGIGSEAPAFHVRKRAGSRLEALQKAMPLIRREFPKLRGTRLAVFIGRYRCPSEAASRMVPLTIPIE